MEATYGEKNYTSRAIDVPNGQTLGVILLFIISHMCDVLCASVCIYLCSGCVHVCEGAPGDQSQTHVSFFKSCPSCLLR